MTRAGTPRTAVVGALLLVVGLLVTALATGASGTAGAGIAVSGTRAFSPDGDGTKDVARIRYTLERRGSVTIEVREASANEPLELRRRLGRQGAGAHVWTWDGRVSGNEPAADGSYVVRVLSGITQGQRLVEVDRRFRVHLGTDPSYGARRRDPVVVFPRTSVVRDEVGLVAVAAERRVEDGRLVVRDPRGRVVARAPLRRARSGDATYAARLAWRARRPDGRPLPAGVYDVSVRGTDLAGNPATARPFEVRVSKRRLTWRLESRTEVPVDSVVEECDRSEGSTCGLTTYCGVVLPSERFAGGLSLRSAVCTGPFDRSEAASTHRVTVPDAVRGIDSYRVGFTGAPTVPGETDTLTLSAGDAVLTSSGAARTSWLTTGPYLEGESRVAEFIAPLRPSVQWRVATVGDDAFDVATFTLDLRYLVVAD